MTTTRLTVGAALAALSLAHAAGLPVALAQGTPDVTALKEVEDDELRVETLGLTVDQLDGMDVLGPGGGKVGEVDDVLADASGRAVAVTVEAGGFLGFGERKVVVGLDRLRNTDGRIVTTMTRDQVKILPAWDAD